MNVNEACRVMTCDAHEGRILPSHPHTNNGLFFSYSPLNNVFYMYIGKHMKKASKNPEFA